MGQGYEETVDDQVFHACHRFARISPRKARLVADTIRDALLDEALTTLRFSPQRAAKMLYKVLRSAQASAEEQGVTHVEDLVVERVWVDEGPTQRSWRPRARGMANMRRRRRSHIHIELALR